MEYLLPVQDTNIYGAPNKHEEVTQKPTLLKEHDRDSL